MASIVGPSGVVSGLDQSEPMVAMSRERCKDQAWVDMQVGEATALPPSRCTAVEIASECHAEEGACPF